MPGNDFVSRAIERRFLSALSASHLDMVGPHSTQPHDAIEAVKPLSPPESRLGDLIVAIITDPAPYWLSSQVTAPSVSAASRADESSRRNALPSPEPDISALL
jgi:hypothetical protein